ncbi:MAG: C45 family peptidase [Casimicrobiaceae bacterium]|nr:C45 family peptidase [Casimicrobiaceae bacterium]MDW8312721.1 C45 family peptidase [Burkholderiales bacterium]
MFPRIELCGGPFERGRWHGLQARQAILGSLRVYRALFEQVGLAWPDACARAWRYREPIADLHPSLYTELQGIAAGCGVSLDALLALNARTELLPQGFFAATRAQDSAQAQSAAQPAECTSVAVSASRMADGRTRVAQNWDWLPAQREHVLVLSIRRAEGPDLIVLTEAGMLGKIGVNAHGLAIGLNILRSSEDGMKLGLPVHVFQRAALDCESVSEVVALAERTAFAASSNAILGDRSGAVACLEYSPGGVAALAPVHGVVLHTNHFCAANLAERAGCMPASATSAPRLERAREIVARWPQAVAPEAIEALLADTSGEPLAAIAREADPSEPPETRVETVFAVVMDCASRTLRVAPDVPSRHPFETLAW